MVSLYVTSVERHAGKELVTLGLIDRLRRDGVKVGYFKPMGHFPIKVDDMVVDKGTWLVQQFFKLEDPIEVLCPVVITQDLVMQNLEREVVGLQEKIEAAFQRVSSQKDVMVIGCDNNLTEGSSFGVSGLDIIRLLKAHALFVERYACNFCVDFLLELKKVIGDSMIGVVFNRVNAIDMTEWRELISPFLNRKDIEIYGTLPHDAFLASIGVDELAKQLGADVVCGKERLEGFVEDFLVGGMQVDTFITYLLKKPNAGIIVGGDRTDIQLVAIETGVKCLVLSGSLYPNNTIVARAEAQGVPILVARDDTYTVAKKVEAIVGEFSLRETSKIEHGIKLVEENLDFKKLYKKLEIGEVSSQ